MRYRYPNLFPGKPSPVPLTGLLLFSPDIDVKLRGGSLRGAFPEEGQESLFKCLERSTKLRISPTEKLVSRLLSWMPDTPMRGDFAVAAGGETSVMERLDRVGPWEAYLSSRGLFLSWRSRYAGSMGYKPTPREQQLIDRAQREFEAAKRSGEPPSRYFLDKCSSEMGIEPSEAVSEAVAPRKPASPWALLRLLVDALLRARSLRK